MPKTLFEKVWDAHVVKELEGGGALLYIDRHLVHEVTSAQAFENLRLKGRNVRRPDKTFAVPDHNVPTQNRNNIENPISKKQIEVLENNANEFGIQLFDLDSKYHGIVHIIGPELGISQPGMTIVCGDSHTSTHGAFGALAIGIGTSQVEHVLATQTLIVPRKPKTFFVEFDGELQPGISSKDVILALIGKIGTAGGTGYVFEYGGSAVKKMSMEERMTLCNMSIEAGARAGMVAPDQVTFEYISQNRPFGFKGKKLEHMIEYFKTLPSDRGASYDKTIRIDVSTLSPQVSWGTNPGMVIGVDEPLPEENEFEHSTIENVRRAYEYMGLKPGMKMSDVEVDAVFIGSCTNGRIEDLRAAGEVFRGKTVTRGVRVLVVPGSYQVKLQAEEEGLDTVFISAGCEWREPGCSMCLAMNPDKLREGERAASTSNRNFEGRQGKGSRTHLVSPKMAAAAAIHGRFVDVRDL